MLVDLWYIMDRIRGPRAHAERVRELRLRLDAQPGPQKVGDEERRLAIELRALRERLSARFRHAEACQTCARGHPPPAGRWPGGHCCSGRTVVFTDDELAALRLSGTTPTDFVPSRSDAAGCAFRGPTGCVLKASHRPNLCVRYVCTSLERELEHRGNRAEVKAMAGQIRVMFDTFVKLRAARLEEEYFASFSL